MKTNIVHVAYGDTIMLKAQKLKEKPRLESEGKTRLIAKVRCLTPADWPFNAQTLEDKLSTKAPDSNHIMRYTGRADLDWAEMGGCCR